MEILIGAGASHPKPTQQKYVSDKRIIAHKIEGIFENKKNEIPLSSISSINTSTKGLGANIDIVASNNNASVEHLHLHIAQELKKIIDSLMIPLLGNTLSNDNTQLDVADQIKKLAVFRNR
ncbi:PH domain-containing protein [Peribacillus frigoritolerans]